MEHNNRKLPLTLKLNCVKISLVLIICTPREFEANLSNHRLLNTSARVYGWSSFWKRFRDCLLIKHLNPSGRLSIKATNINCIDCGPRLKWTGNINSCRCSHNTSLGPSARYILSSLMLWNPVFLFVIITKIKFMCVIYATVVTHI